MKKCPMLLILAVLLAVPPRNAGAFQRAYQPLNVAITMADAIIIARTVRVPQQFTGTSAVVKVSHTLKGSLAKGNLMVRLSPVHALALGPLQNDKEYIFFLSATGARSPRFEVMLDGTRLYAPRDAERIKAGVNLIPAWSPSRSGLATTLIPEKFRVKVGEDINLWVGYKNVSRKNIRLKYRDWPLAIHTYWKLIIKSKTGGIIAAQKHPTLTKAEITDYFSRFPRSSDSTLKPQQEFFFPLPRINTAKPGWGYKETLDFKYYPITQPGQYSIAARAQNFQGGQEALAKGLKIWVE